MVELLGALLTLFFTAASLLVGLIAAIVPLVAFIAVFVLIAKVALDSRRKRWELLANTWGLTIERGKLHGRVEGIDVELEERSEGGKNKTTYAYYRFKLPAHWSGLVTLRDENLLDAVGDVFGGSDIEIGDKVLDDRLRIGGCPHTARSILADEAIREAYLDLRRRGGLSLGSGRIQLRKRGNLSVTHDELFRAGIRLAKALETAWWRPWRQAATALGLDLSDDGLRLDGTFGEHPVEVRHVPGKQPSTTLRVPLYRTLPAGTRIGRTGDGDSLRLGDPILDGNLHVAGNAAVLGPLLRDDETRALVMTLVHGLDGTVTDTEIVVHTPGRLMDELEQTIRDAVILARRLSERPRSADPATVAHRAKRPQSQ